jgi:hypothetical protein
MSDKDKATAVQKMLLDPCPCGSCAELFAWYGNRRITELQNEHRLRRNALLKQVEILSFKNVLPRRLGEVVDRLNQIFIKGGENAKFLGLDSAMIGPDEHMSWMQDKVKRVAGDTLIWGKDGLIVGPDGPVSHTLVEIHWVRMVSRLLISRSIDQLVWNEGKQEGPMKTGAGAHSKVSYQPEPLKVFSLSSDLGQMDRVSHFLQAQQFLGVEDESIVVLRHTSDKGTQSSSKKMPGALSPDMNTQPNVPAELKRYFDKMERSDIEEEDEQLVVLTINRYGQKRIVGRNTLDPANTAYGTNAVHA